MEYGTWCYSLVYFQSPISARNQTVNRFFVHIPGFFQQHLPTNSLSLFRNVFSTFSWLCLGLSCFTAGQLLVPCQARRLTPIHELLLNLGTSSEVNGWAVNLSNDKLSSFPSIAWTAASVRCCQWMASEPLLLLKQSVQTPFLASLQRPP